METKQITKEETTYLSCAETAKLVRKALKVNFPSQKFSVKSSVYSMGASIDVSWTDGIPQDEVNTICKQFEGAGFDGMIDLKYYITHWMMPDGSLITAKNEGTSDSGGVYHGYENEKPHPDAKKIHMGADYVFANRDISKDALKSAAKQIAKLNDMEFDSLNDYPKDNFFGGMGNNWWGIARELLYKNEINGPVKILRREETCAGSWTDFYKVLPLREAN
tara:strand:+ start:93 stop:752 length:660 start_codon:yes stop_codon:yes gene_type:complete